MSEEVKENGARTIAETTFEEETNLLTLWGGVLIAPAAYFLQLFVAYGLVDWVCRSGNSFVITLTTILALALCLLGGFFAWTNWKAAGMEFTKDEGDPANRTRFMSIGGLILSALFFVAILAQEVPNWIVGACVGR
jgi:hypothetical protein